MYNRRETKLLKYPIYYIPGYISGLNLGNGQQVWQFRNSIAQKHGSAPISFISAVALLFCPIVSAVLLVS
jgi:hypothetical protein